MRGQPTWDPRAQRGVAKLKAKGRKGFTISHSGKTFKVEKGYATQKQARSELAKLKTDGFRGKVAKA